MSTYDLAPERRSTGALWGVVLVGGALVLGRQIVAGGPMLRVIAAVVVMGVLAVPAIERPRQAVLSLFVLLPFLGMIRHAFVSATGAAFLDPLLLVTSAVAVTIFASLMLNGEMDFGGTSLATVVFLLLVVGIIQVFNPNQGSLLVGLSGVMINLIPIGFFFIARSVSDHQMTQKVIRIVLVVGAITAAYGLVQVFVGFRGFEKAYISSNGYGALTVGETTRPFSTFNNAAEYAAYAHYAFVAAFTALVFAPKTRRTLLLGVVALVAYSGFLIGSRGFTVKVVIAVIALLATRARSRILSLAVIVLLGASAFLWASTTTSTENIQDKEKGAGQLIQQQVRALADPFDRTKSTLPVHFEQATRGISRAITKEPWGIGTGSTTRGAAKFGGQQAGTELDIGDVFQSLGVAGGFLYLAAIGIALIETARVRKALPGYVWVTVWAMALTSVGAWLNGGMYAITPLIWFLIGAADGEYRKLRDRHLIDGTLAT